MTRRHRAARPLQREMQFLIGSLVAFLSALIVAVAALTMLILRMDRLESTSRAVAAAVAPLVATSPAPALQERLDFLRGENDIARIEVYRGSQLHVASGDTTRASEALAEAIPSGRIIFYFDTASWSAGRRNALIIGALATLATIGGMLILIVYLPKFVRPIEELLIEAERLGGDRRGDDDARYLVDSFRDAVERINDQANELKDLRDAASSRKPDIHSLAQALGQSFTSGFLALDASGSVVAINPAGRTILGLERDEPGEPFPLSLLAPEFAGVLRSALEGRTTITRLEVSLHSSDTVFGVTTAPLYEEERFAGMFAVFTDLTAFRSAEARVRDVENLVALGQMSAGIAHEFRNSLFTILGYLRLAQRSAAPETAAKIRSAEAEAATISAAVDALLNFARPLTIRPQRVRLDEIVSAVVTRFDADSNAIAFITSTDGAVYLQGDRELLERAFENVVRNAIDAVRQRHPEGGGRIEIGIAAEPHPSVVIRDNGVGVDPEQAASFLLPFQSGKPTGFGLGLPLARKIVLHHGGTLSLTGVPGEGATVRIDFYGVESDTKSNTFRTTPTTDAARTTT